MASNLRTIRIGPSLLLLLFFTAARSPCAAAPPSRNLGQDAACNLLKARVAAVDHLPPTGPMGMGWHCDESTLGGAHWYVMALRSQTKCNGCDHMMGWFAVNRVTGSLHTYDIARLKVGRELEVRNAIRTLFERAVAETGRHGGIPIYIITTLPETMAVGADVIVRADGTPNGYNLSLQSTSVSGDAGFLAGIGGSRDPQEKPDLPRAWRPVKLADGTSAWFHPVSCGGSCAPASLLWHRPGADYTVQLALPSWFDEDHQLHALVQMANSVTLSAQH